MKMMSQLPVFSINNFEDYNHCEHCGNNFYIRVFDKHLQDNQFIEKPHRHDFFILLIITSGSGKHVIDFKSYDVTAGSVFLVAPGQVHHWDLSKDINGYILFFTKEYLMMDFNHDRISKLPFLYNQINNPSISLEKADLPPLLHLLQTMAKEYMERDRYFHNVIRLNLQMLLIELERRYQSKKLLPELMKFQENQLHRLEALVDTHYKEHHSVLFYADKMNLSIKQINTFCKKALNKTVGDLVLERLILEAKRMLIHSDYTVSTISQLLNYSDNSYFTRLFKNYTNMTPEQFRNSNASF
jgi:AraC family transcriptional activator of pobA